MHNKAEVKALFIIKFVTFALFLGVLIYTWISQETPWLIATGICLIIVPILAIIYSYTIFNMKCMTKRRVGNRNANANPDENNRRRMADAAELDER